MNVIFVDDHPLFREALRSMIRLGLPHARIEEAESIGAAKAVLGERPTADLIMLDLSMTGVTGFDGLMSLRIAYPRIPIVVVSVLDELRIVREACNSAPPASCRNPRASRSTCRPSRRLPAGGSSPPTRSA